TQEIGKAESAPAISFYVKVEIEGVPLEYNLPLIYKHTDPAKGELYRPFVITPPVCVNFKEPIHLFSNKETQIVEVVVKSGVNQFSGELRLQAPKGWQLEQSVWNIDFSKKGEEQLFSSTLTPDKTPENGS